MVLPKSESFAVETALAPQHLLVNDRGVVCSNYSALTPIHGCSFQSKFWPVQHARFAFLGGFLAKYFITGLPYLLAT